jgi:hypothetical protein
MVYHKVNHIATSHSVEAGICVNEILFTSLAPTILSIIAMKKYLIRIRITYSKRGKKNYKVS